MDHANSSPLGVTNASPTATPLQTLWLLSVLIFLTGYTLEVLDYNDLYESQQFLLVLLQLAFSLWALIEWALLIKSQPAIPLAGLGLALIAQLLLELTRWPLDGMMESGRVQFDSLSSHLDLGLAFIYAPLNLFFFLLISKLLIDAFSFTERQRAAMLQREIKSRLRAEEDLNRSLTARMQAEAEVRSLRTQLERTAYEVTENIPVGTYTMVLPPDAPIAHFSFMSRRFLELTGLDREAAASDPFKAFACVHPDDYDRWVQLNIEAFVHKQRFFGETRIIVGGEERWISAESSPRNLPDGATVWEGVLVDITARKQAEGALLQAHAALVAAEAERAQQAERQRLLQDMHDGFGSQLATARLRMSQGELTLAEGGDLLGECLADLHLLADTLGSTDHSLTRAMANFRYRCERRLAQGPSRIHWHLRLKDCPPLPERTLLQTLRILQEGLHNALKHAQARHIQVDVQCLGKEGLVLCVADDGIGLPAVVRHGRGLGNMESRARDIDARLKVERLTTGTRLVLTLPLRPPDARDEAAAH